MAWKFKSLLSILVWGHFHTLAAARESDSWTQVNLTLDSPVEVQSENYPLEYPYNAFETWLVTSPPNTLIRITILDLQFGKHDLEKDFLYIGDGSNYTVEETGYRLPRDPADGTNANVEGMISKGPEVWLQFMSDHIQSDRGFKLQLKAVSEWESCSAEEFLCKEEVTVCMNATAVCDGLPECTDLSDETNCEYCGEKAIDLSQGGSHVLNSPKYPNKFPSRIFCHWLINASDAAAILLSFVKFSLQEYKDLFIVGTGHGPHNANSTLLMRRGSVIPFHVVVESSQVWVGYDTLAEHPQKESLLEVILQEVKPKACDNGTVMCDTGLKCIQGTAVCDGFPDCSDQSDEFNCGACLNDEDTCSCFQKRSHQCNGVKDCDDFYDELHCLPCGEQFIHLSDDHDATHPFNLTSPGYPSKYPANSSCLWLVTAPPRRRLLVRFADLKLNLDTLSLGNGHRPSNASSLILRRSGATAPTVVSSDGPEMWVTLESDSSTFRGFVLEISQFVTVVCSADEFACTSGYQCVNQLVRCDNSTDCEDFSDEIGCSDSCGSDQLTCENGSCVNSDWMCDGYADCSDFKDETGCRDLCGERNIWLRPNDPPYQLISPDYPGEKLPPYYTCRWFFSTYPDLQLALKVEHLDLSKTLGDQLQLGDGHSPSDSPSVFAELKADNKEIVGKSLLSSESRVWVSFVVRQRPTSFLGWRQFELTISLQNTSGECVEGYFRCDYYSLCVPEKSRCNGRANCDDFSDEKNCLHCGGSSSSNIDLASEGKYLLTASLTNENTFPSGKDCLWLVTAQAGSRIQLNFLYFILISDRHNYRNDIKVGDGHNPQNKSSQFFEHTGRTVRQVITSSGPQIWIAADTETLQFEEGFSVHLMQYNAIDCSTTQYTCPSGQKCIKKDQRCDGTPQCPDAGDEFGCGSCLPEQLQCDRNVCLEPDQICNGNKDCDDHLDERMCAPCGDTTITLRDLDKPLSFSSPSYGLTDKYPFSMKCTWHLTATHSDYRIQLEFEEFATELNYDKLSVGNGDDSTDVSTAILAGISGGEAPRIVVSDGSKMWIEFNTDEMVADKGWLLSITQTNGTVQCRESELRCLSGPGMVCLHYSFHCNGFNLCADKSDEKRCGDCGLTEIYLFNEQAYNLTSPGYPGEYPTGLRCQWLIHATDEKDEMVVKQRKIIASFQAFQLENQYDYLTMIDPETKETNLVAKLTGQIRLTRMVSSGPSLVVQFRTDNTGSGLGFKMSLKPVDISSADTYCSGTDRGCGSNMLCVSEDALCNGFNDCLNYYDETNNCENIQCPNDYMCDNEIHTDEDLRNYECITYDLVCNGSPDCRDGDDERQCDKEKCPSECTCYYDNRGLSIKCLGAWTQDTVDYMAKTVTTLTLNGGNVTVLKKGTFKGMRSLRTLSLSNNNIVTIEPRTFDGLGNLTWLELSRNNITELEANSFKELSTLEGLTLWDVPLQKIQSDAFTGLEKLKKLAIIRGILDSPLDMDHDEFNGLINLQTLYVDDHRLCCYRQNVTCTSLEPRPPLFKCSNLMPQLALRIFMWVLGISALIGNFGIMVWRFREKNSKASRQVHSFLVFNLAVSDFLMGVYMVIVAAADVYYGDDYFNQARTWRNTALCKIASVLSILSSEASVFIVTVITVDRFLCIVFPFSQLHLRRSSSRLILMIIWTVTISVSLVPTLLADEESNIYGLSDVCIGLPLQTRATDFASTKQDIGSPFSNETFDTPVALNYQPSWVFSIILFLGVNFICFLIILVCYIVIFIHVQLSLKQVNRHMHRFEEIKMAGKMALIVGTDLVCWLPIIIMGILAQTGTVSIPVEMYAWIVVFILPINSALNPYLYTVSSCVADRRRENHSTATTRRNGTLPMTDRVNFDKSMHSQEISIVD